MKFSNRFYDAVFVIFLLVVYSVVQLSFFNYYSSYGLVFGMSDIDRYMYRIENKGFELEHLMVFMVGNIPVNAGLIFTFLIPFFACCLVPMALYLFSIYFSKQRSVALLTVLFFIFGTYYLQGFLVWGLWSQHMNLFFFLLSIVFFEESERSGWKRHRLVVIVLLILSFISHYKLIALFIVYLMSKFLIERRYVLFSLFLVLGLYSLSHGIDLDYSSKISLGFVLTMYINQLIWIFALIYMLFEYGNVSESLKRLMLMVVLIFLSSPLIALWRPIFSILPILAFFAALFVVRGGFHSGGIFHSKAMGLLFLIIVFILLLVYFTNTTKDILGQMLWEMLPDKIDNPRSLDPKPFINMIYGDDVVYRVTGHISSLDGSTYEAEEIIHPFRANISMIQRSA